MSLLVVSNLSADHHETGDGHPERPARTRAAWDGLVDAGLSEAVIPIAPRVATARELHLVHPPAHLGFLETYCASGGGNLDPDTPVSPGSWETALLATGAGLEAAAALRRDLGEGGLVLVRPPGHHAGPERAMGFCLLNNLAVVAADLVERGERVLIFDWDVHHGNGTQEIFWSHPGVLFVSTHQRGLFPGTGRVVEVGGPGGEGLTMNIPLPPGTTGRALRRAVEELVAPAAARFSPTWLLVSAGFDGHRADPLADWLLTAGDYADLIIDLSALVTPGHHRLLFLEGGYDLPALRASVGATAAALLGERYRPEAPSSGGPGEDDVEKIAAWRAAQPWASG